jgi:hypothetical protein
MRLDREVLRDLMARAAGLAVVENAVQAKVGSDLGLDPRLEMGLVLALDAAPSVAAMAAVALALEMSVVVHVQRMGVTHVRASLNESDAAPRRLQK